MAQRIIFRSLRQVIAVLIFGVFLGITWYQRHEVLVALQHVSSARAGLIITLLSLMYLASAAAWQQLLRGIGSPLPYRAALAIWVVSNVARYIPGTIWQFIGRVFFAGEHDVSRARTLISVLYEIALLILAALIVILVSIPFWPVSFLLPWWASLIGLGALTILWPTTLPKLVAWLGRIRRTPIEVVPVLPWQDISKAFAFMLLRIISGGLGFWVLASLFVPFTPMQTIGVVGMYSLAWLIGYVTVFAPAGVGVADGTLIGLLATRISTTQSFSVVVIFRALLLLSELLVLLIALSLHPAIFGQAKAIRQSTVK